MSKRFDLAITLGKPHEHFCRDCRNIIYCRADPCVAPEWGYCADCNAGVRLVRTASGDIEARKKIPYRPGSGGVRDEHDWN